MMDLRPLPNITRHASRAGALVTLALAGSGCDEGGWWLAGGDARATGSAFNVVGVFGEVGRSPGQFIYPRAIDSDGRTLWVIDKSARVQRLDPRTGAVLAWWQLPDSIMGKPVGVTVAPGEDGEPCVYVPDTHYHRVLVYGIGESDGVTKSLSDGDGGRRHGGTEARTHEGEELSTQHSGLRTRKATLGSSSHRLSVSPSLLLSVGSFGEGPGEFIYPTDVGVLVDGEGRPERFYVSEFGGNDRVSVFDRDFDFLFDFGSPKRVGSAWAFDRPQGLAVDERAREVVVVDSSNHRLGRFTLEGELIAWIGSPETAGTGAGCFKYPFGLTLLGDGTALVAEFGNNRVQRIELSTGRSTGIYGAPGRGPGELVTPWGVTTLGGLAYVLDSGNCRVQAFRVGGAW